MFDAPIEDWYVWLGVTAVSVAVLGVAVGLPTVGPPATTAVADTIDRVATSPPGSTASYDLRAEEIRIDRRRIGLRGDGGTTHAEIAFGPTTPAMADERLLDVLDGRPPRSVFESPAEFSNATARARDGTAVWRPAPETLDVRRVSWEGTDVLLVG